MTRTATAILVALGLSGALVASGCGSGSSRAVSGSSSAASRPASVTPPAATRSVTVVISGYAYHPAGLTVAPGTRIVFTNHDATAHTATASRGFDTGTIEAGHSATVVARTAATYSYICQFHPFMRAQVVVR